DQPAARPARLCLLRLRHLLRISEEVDGRAVVRRLDTVHRLLPHLAHLARRRAEVVEVLARVPLVQRKRTGVEAGGLELTAHVELDPRLRRLQLLREEREPEVEDRRARRVDYLLAAEG